MDELTAKFSNLLRCDRGYEVRDLSASDLPEGRISLAGNLVSCDSKPSRPYASPRFLFEIPILFDDWDYLSARARVGLQKGVDPIHVSVRSYWFRAS